MNQRDTDLMTIYANLREGNRTSTPGLKCAFKRIEYYIRSQDPADYDEFNNQNGFPITGRPPD